MHWATLCTNATYFLEDYITTSLCLPISRAGELLIHTPLYSAGVCEVSVFPCDETFGLALNISCQLETLIYCVGHYHVLLMKLCIIEF